jgi:hypothetical protein
MVLTFAVRIKTYVEQQGLAIVMGVRRLFSREEKIFQGGKNILFA